MGFFDTFGAIPGSASDPGPVIDTTPTGFLTTTVGDGSGPTGYSPTSHSLGFGNGVVLQGIEATSGAGSILPSNTASTFYILQSVQGTPAVYSYWIVDRNQTVDGFWGQNFHYGSGNAVAHGALPTINQVLSSTYFGLIDWSTHVGALGSAGADIIDLSAAAGGGTLSGNLGSDRLTGGSHNDDFSEIPGDRNIIIGGGGLDVLDYSKVPTEVGVVINGGYFGLLTSIGDTVTGLELIVTTEKDDDIRLVVPDSMVDVGVATATITLGGDDRVYGTSLNDAIDTGVGEDTVFGGDGNDAFRDVAVAGERNVFDGGGGVDFLRYKDGAIVGTVGVVINGGFDGLPNTGDTAVHLELIETTDFDDDVRVLTPDSNLDAGSATSIRTYAGDDRVYGSDRADLIVTDEGDDIVFGGDGNDALNGGPGNDILDGGPGEDSARFAGDASRYKIALSADGESYSVTDKVTGEVDALSNIEWAAFDDITIALDSLRVAEPTETVTIQLELNSKGQITSPDQTGSIHFFDSFPNAVVVYLISGQDITAKSPGLFTIPLTEPQIAEIIPSFSLTLNSENGSDGTIDWKFNPRLAQFVARGETVQLDVPIQVSDQFGARDTSVVTVTLKGADPTPELSKALELGSLVAESLGNTAEVFGIALSQNAAFAWLEELGAKFKAAGTVLKATAIVNKFETNWAAAGSDELKQWLALREFVVDVVNEAEKSAFDFAVTTVLKEYGLTAATWAFESASGAEASAAFQVATALFEAAGVTIGAPALATAVIVVGGAVAATIAYDMYIEESARKITEEKFLQYVPPPNGVVVNGEHVGHGSDGYLSGSTVFADANGNGDLNAGEASTTTDGQGNFDLYGGTGPLVAKGGIDILTGLALSVALRAPEGSSNITPLTTIVAALQDLGIADEHQAEQMVLLAFGLNPLLGLTGLDPVGAAKASDAMSSQAFAAGVEAFDTAVMIASALSGQGADLAQSGRDTLAAVAASINNLGVGQILDLANAATIESLIESVAQTEGITLTPDVVDALSLIISSSNSSLQEVWHGGLAGTEFVVAMAAIALAAQGATADALRNMVAHPDQLQATVDAHTGTSLADLIAAASAQIPLQAANDDASVAANSTLAVTDASLGVLGNDNDPAGSAMSITGVGGADGPGSVGQAFAGAFGSLTMNADGTYVYVAGSVVPGGVATDRFEYTVSDALGHSDNAELRIAIAGPPVPPNDPPAATHLTQAIVYTEGAASVAWAAIVVSDPDTGDTITATLALANPTAGALTTSGAATYTPGTGIWTVSGTVAAVNAALAAVTFTPATHNLLDTTITTHVRDAAGMGPADGTIALAVNEAPVINSNGGAASVAVSIAENTTAVTTMTATDSDTPSSSLSFSIFGGADAGKFAINAVSGVLGFIAAPDFETRLDAGANNVYDVVVRASDGAGGTDDQAIAVSVTNVLGNTINGTAAGNTIDATHAVAGKHATGEEDTIKGLGGNDTLKGLNGNDLLDGGVGNDKLFGGLGLDRLTGGAGLDQYVFDTAPGAGNVDTLHAFSHVEDTLVLDRSFFTRLGALGSLNTVAFYAATFAGGSTPRAHDATDRIVYNKRDGSIWYDADGNKVHGLAAVEIAVLDTHPANVAASDFLVVA